MLDLLVIGAGLSGLMAAHRAASAGLSVRIVSKGLNALHWSAGTIDVLGYLPPTTSEPVEQPLAALDRLLAAHPQHPYGLIGRDDLVSGLEQFQEISRSLRLPYSGHGDGRNMLLASPVGALRPVYLAPKAQAQGDLRKGGGLLIVGFDGMRDFYPQLIAENLRKQGFRARAVHLPLDLITTRHDYNTVQLAQAFEQENRAERVAAALKAIVKPGERIGLPAILGMEDHDGVMAALQGGTNSTIFEIPTLPPSVPGIRLFRRLRAGLRELGVRLEVGMMVIEAEVSPGNGAPGHVSWVATESSARPLRHHARNFLLATGGILGGGFNSDYTGRVWETIFDLPLTTPQRRTEWFRPSFLSPEGHPVFDGGVVVDAQMRPLSAGGQPVYDNLWVAGNMLAHVDSIQERSMEGLAICSGIAAAQAIEQRNNNGV